MIFFKHRRSAEQDTFSVPHSVQKSIPIKRIYQDGVFQVSGKFSKTWRFFDVNYAVASPEKQRELFMTYCSFLNSLPIGATAKITLFNRQLNQKDFGRTLLMPMQGDRRDLYRNEYNALVLGKAAESNNLIQEKYITVSAEKKSVEEARAFFSRVGTDLTTGLSRMSSSVREITVNDRLRLLHTEARKAYFTEQMICEILMALEQTAMSFDMEYDDRQKAMSTDLSKAARKEWYLRHKDKGLEP